MSATLGNATWHQANPTWIITTMTMRRPIESQGDQPQLTPTLRRMYAYAVLPGRR